MRVPIKIAGKRRPPVPPSKPTYEVDLTWSELRQIKMALRDRIATVGYPDSRDTVSALAVIQWAMDGRQ